MPKALTIFSRFQNKNPWLTKKGASPLCDHWKHKCDYQRDVDQRDQGAQQSRSSHLLWTRIQKGGDNNGIGRNGRDRDE